MLGERFAGKRVYHGTFDELPFFMYSTQKHEELSSNNGPVSIADIENDTIVKLVDAGVTAMMTRLQSESHG